MQTTATRDGDVWVINGAKTFITGGMKGDYFVVGARTGGEGLLGISLFFVDAGSPGFSRTPLERKMGWWASIRPRCISMTVGCREPPDG